MILDDLKVKGKLKITHTKGETGEEKTYMFNNLVVDAGLVYIAGRLVDTGTDAGHTIPPEMSHMGIGEGVTTSSTNMTALESQLTRQTISVVNVGGATVQYDATYPPTVGTGALTEAGIFNDASAGTMLCRTTFPVVNKQAADTITLQWTISILAS